MSRTLVAALAVSVLLVALAPLVSGHAAPPPRPFETRLLHDHNDDSAIVLAGKHGFDSIALDVREARLPSGEDALVLRLILNGGCNEQVPTECPALREVVRFEAPDGPHEVSFETSDGGVTWTGNAAKYVGPEALNDGTRFAIEAWAPYASFAGSTGTTLTGWFVEGYAGEATADDMPAGAVAGLPDPFGAAYDAGTYTLADREYLRLEAATTNLTGPANATTDVTLRLANLVGLEQNASIAIDGPAVIVSPEASTGTLALAPNFTAELVLRVTLTNGPSTVNVTVATPLGGFARLALDATGEVPPPIVAENGTHDDDHTHGDEDKDTPGPAPALVLVAVVALAVALRRRR
ncbi:MAG: hypothetical protein ACYC2H_00240 [Thermoplasmatota archaeon]